MGIFRVFFPAPTPRCVCPVLLVLLALLAGGCASKATRPEDPVRPFSDTIVKAPEDDGIDLSPSEEAALRSTGQLDRNLSESDLRDVMLEYKSFLHQKRRTMERFSRQAAVYLPHARKAFRDRGMPEELACLAIVESGYNPTATSSAGAAGSWQFMPSTGAHYGLDQDWWMDERRDPCESAEAAADYLKKLYGDFQDWHLAIAAYNAGEGKIGRALEKSGARSFFELKRKNAGLDERTQLREETKQYVPRFLAVCKIMRNLEQLGFAPCREGDPTCCLVRVDVRPGTDLLALSRAAGMSWEEFSKYNAAHKRHVSRTDRPSHVHLPAAREKDVLAYLRNPQASGTPGWRTCIVGKGDTWQKLSRRSGVPVAVLQSSNKGLTRLQPGMMVVLPGSSALRVPTAPALAARGVDKKTPPAVSPRSYTLKSGDTLHEVARQHSVSVKDLLACNDLDDPCRLKVGQRLRVPDKGTARSVARAGEKATRSASAATRKNLVAANRSAPRKVYTVQPGDTVWGIARKHNVSPRELLQLNISAANGALRPGDTLVLAQ